MIDFDDIWQISSKSILIISSYAVSKLMRILRHSVVPQCL